MNGCPFEVFYLFVTLSFGRRDFASDRANKLIVKEMLHIQVLHVEERLTSDSYRALSPATCVYDSLFLHAREISAIADRPKEHSNQSNAPRSDYQINVRQWIRKIAF